MITEDEAKTKFTPGTWGVSNGRLLRINALPIDREHPVVVCGVHRIGRFNGIAAGDALANARLIAAAPDLYAALVEARAWFSDNGPLAQKLDAALAKARGEQP